MKIIGFLKCLLIQVSRFVIGHNSVCNCFQQDRDKNTVIDNSFLNPDKADNDEKNITGKREMIPGKTLIGQKRESNQKKTKLVDIYYGNLSKPLKILDGRYVPLPEKEYFMILWSFLDSEEGKKYRYPSKKQIGYSTMAEPANPQIGSHFIPIEKARQSARQSHLTSNDKMALFFCDKNII